MPIRITWPRAGAILACAIPVLLALLMLPGAAGATRSVELRVVDPDGRTLAEHRQYTGSTRVPTDPRARCFFGGAGGSGDPVRTKGPNAIGALRDAARLQRSLRPLSFTDEFDFGLGVCGIGGAVADPDSFWLLRVNHEDAAESGDRIRLRRGDRVLWFLSPTTPPPELELRAPARAVAGSPFEVEVVEHRCELGPAPDFETVCGSEPAAGATVRGAAGPTDADGTAIVTRPVGLHNLRARRGSDIPSNRARVCVAERLGECPRVAGERILGSAKRDRIRGTRGPDVIEAGRRRGRIAAGAGDDRIDVRRGRNRIRAGRGDDRVDARRGGRDVVRCGRGEDVAIVDRRDRARGCEEVRTRR